MDQFVSQKFRFYSFLSMVLLVFVHAYNLNNRYLLPYSIVNEPLNFTTFLQYFLANGIFRFRIPMLFIISGYLFSLRDDKPYGERVLKRLRTLFAPYLLWSIIGILVTLLFEQWFVSREAVVQSALGPFAEKRIAEYGFKEYAIRWFLAPIPFQLWFIRCLLVYNLMYPWLKAAVTRFPIVTFSVAGFLWLTSFYAGFIEGEGLLFFTMGIWISKTQFDIQHPPKWLPVVQVLIFWVILSIFKTNLAFKSYIGSFQVAPLLIVLHKMVVLSGLAGVWYGFDPVVKLFMNQKWFVWLSAFSFIIYALHVPLINYAINLSFMYTNTIPYFRFLNFFLLPLLVIGICVLTGVILRTALPKVYGLLTGGRGMM